VGFESHTSTKSRFSRRDNFVKPVDFRIVFRFYINTRLLSSFKSILAKLATI